MEMGEKPDVSSWVSLLKLQLPIFIKKIVIY